MKKYFPIKKATRSCKRRIIYKHSVKIKFLFNLKFFYFLKNYIKSINSTKKVINNILHCSNTICYQRLVKLVCRQTFCVMKIKVKVKVKVKVDINPVFTSFKKWGKPGYFAKALAKGPKSTTWIWNLHADVHDFDAQITSLEDISRKIFSAHFGQLAIIILWISGMWFHGARFSNYASWLVNPITIQPSSHVVWPIIGQEILNGDLGGGFSGVRITSGWFELWASCGITTETELYWSAIGGLFISFLLVLAGWVHYHKLAPKLAWFQNIEAILNHHIGGLLGLGSLGWSGHEIHVSIPIQALLEIGLAPAGLPIPHEFILNIEILTGILPCFKFGLHPFFTVDILVYRSILTFKGGLDSMTGCMWVNDLAHHHLSIAVIFLISGHLYRTNWVIGHGIDAILTGHQGPFTGIGHIALYSILTTSWHAQLAINLAMMGSISIIVSHHMYSMPSYVYISIDYATNLSIFTHHMWIGGFCISGAGAHGSLFMVRDYSPRHSFNNILDRMILHRDAIISHLNWVCIFLGTHSFGLYIHNDTMRALGRLEDTFADSRIQLQPIFAQAIQSWHSLAPGNTAPNVLVTPSYVFGGDIIAINGKIAIMPISLGTADFLVHHIHAFTIHVTVLVFLKGVLFARSSRLIPDKADLGFRFPCDGPGRGGTCQISAWDHVFLGLFWMYNSISIVIFHFSWKMQSDVWGTVSGTGRISHFTAGNFANSALTVNGWLRDFLWAQASQVIQSYGSSESAYGLIFLGAHFTWAFSLMFLFSGRGYWQELIESIVWAHGKLKLRPYIRPRALSITQGRGVGLAHYLLGGIGTTWAFFLARITSI